MGWKTRPGPLTLVRSLRLHVYSSSLPAQVLQQQAPGYGRLSNKSDETFIRDLLVGQADEVFIGPLPGDGKVVAMVCADNDPVARPTGPAGALEVF